METDAEASGIQSWLFGFCERHIDHNPNTPLSDFFQPYGVAPYAAGENRIGGHKIGHSFTEQYDPGLFPNAGTEQPKASCF
jgi:hypothetical protein